MIRRRSEFRPRAAARLACIFVAAAAAGQTVAARAQDADAVYRALADNELSEARAAAKQLAGAEPTAALARFDVLETARALDEIPAAVAAAVPAARLPLARALAARDEARAQQLAAQWARDAASGDAAERGEAGLYLALVAYQSNQPAAAVAAAAPALLYWHGAAGARARWREALLGLTLSRAEYVAGHFDRAYAAASQAHAVAAAAFGAGCEMALRIALAEAGAAHTLGRFERERDVLEAALDLARTRPPQAPLRMLLEGAYGSFLNLTGDYDAARGHYDAAEAILRAGAAVDPGDAMRFENGFGMLLLNQGEARAALERFTRALAAFPDDPAYAVTNAIVARNKADAELKLGEFAAADADYARSIAYRERGGDRDSAGVALAYHGLGAVALAQARFADAEVNFRRALDLTPHGWAAGHPEIAVLEFGLALARWGQQDDADAFAHALKAAENQHTQLMHFVGGFDEEASVRYRELMVPATALAVTLAARRGDTASIEAAWRLAMRERALIAADLTRRFAAAHVAHDARLAAPWNAWRKASEALASAWTRAAADASEVARANETARRAERAFWQAAGAVHGADDTLPTPAELARALPPGGHLFALAEGLAGPPSRLLFAAHGAVQEPEDWYAFVLAPDAAPKLLRLGSIKQLSADALAWYTAARNPASDAQTLARYGAALRAQLFDASGVLDTAGSLFFVPDGELFRLNPAALPQAGGGFAVERGIDVQILDHERDLLLPAASTAHVRAVLAGAPNFAGVPAARAANTTPACALAAQQGFAAIPHAAEELGEVKALLDAALGRGAHVQLIEGDDATVEHVLAALGGADVVHLATHGFSLDETCAAATRGARAVALARDPPRPGAAALSGLAFAGASLASGADALGILSAQHLMFLDLSHAGWVVLSACDSGLGPIRRGEGVFGMRRALRFAGAPTVIMSLWQIDDAATADLMRALYHARFAEHRPVPQALGGAMRDFLRSRRAAGLPDHPYYWAAFIAEGGLR